MGFFKSSGELWVDLRLSLANTKPGQVGGFFALVFIYEYILHFSDNWRTMAWDFTQGINHHLSVTYSTVDK